jgi:hypothetical protein
MKENPTLALNKIIIIKQFVNKGVRESIAMLIILSISNTKRRMFDYIINIPSCIN